MRRNRAAAEETGMTVRSARTARPSRPSSLWAEAGVFVFDVEGTLVDAIMPTLLCWRDTLQSFGHDVTLADLHALSGMDGKRMLENLLPRVTIADRDEMAERQGQRFRADYLTHVPAFPGVRGLFERLKAQGRRIALATDCQRDQLEHYLAITGIAPLLDAVACGSDGKAGKPAPDLVSLALKRVRVGARSAVLVGDTPYDAQAAQKAGIRSIGVLTGHFPRSVLCEAGCDAVLHDVVRLGDAVEAAAVQPSRVPKVTRTAGHTGGRRPIHGDATRTSAITGR
ncbi:MAG: hypothetical protein V7604_3706 [Hyphomicrobiales bacterium]